MNCGKPPVGMNAASLGYLPRMSFNYAGTARREVVVVVYSWGWVEGNTGTSVQAVLAGEKLGCRGAWALLVPERVSRMPCMRLVA